MGYHPVLREKLIRPIITHGKEGVDDVVSLMTELSLTRDDWGNITQLGESFSSLKNDGIDSRVKTYFTKTLNNENILLKVTRASDKKFKVTQAKSGPPKDDDDEEEEDNNGDDEDITKDKMIQQAKGKGKT